MEKRDIVIIGSGISGLSCASFLKMQGANPLVLEASDRVGGVLKTVVKDGYTMDFSSSSIVEKYSEISKLIEWLELSDSLVTASSASKKRIIYRYGRLNMLAGPISIIFTPLLSFKAKLRVAMEPFVKAKRDGIDESMADFVTRRFGKEFLDNVMNPLVGGIFAGDPKMLSMQAAYPNMLEMESDGGSVIVGALKKIFRSKKDPNKPSRDILSLKGGMETLSKSISSKVDIKLNCKVDQVTKQQDGRYLIKCGESEVIADKVVAAIPAYELSKIIADKRLSSSLTTIPYPATIVLNLGFKKSDIYRDFESFGFLVPEVEGCKFLGAKYCSPVFPHVADDDKVLFNLFIGGSRDQSILERPIEKVVDDVIDQFKSIMDITAEPDLSEYYLWKNSIPQYDMGHTDIWKDIDAFQYDNPNFKVIGNYVGGNGVADCIRTGSNIAEKLMEN